MSILDWNERAALAVAAAFALAGVQAAYGAIGADPSLTVAQLARPTPPRALDGAADVTLRFVQEGGPASGHVRVELTPDNRPLTLMEARMAAEQAFLAALNEPGLGDGLTRITVLVKLDAGGDPALSRTFLYLSKGGSQWSLTAAE